MNAIRIEFEGKTLQGNNASGILPLDVTALIGGNPHTFPYIGVNPVNVTSGQNINITFPSQIFIPPSAYANIQLIEMHIRYEFDPDTVNITQSANYTYQDGRNCPVLKPGILEVRVW